MIPDCIALPGFVTCANAASANRIQTLKLKNPFVPGDYSNRFPAGLCVTRHFFERGLRVWSS